MLELYHMGNANTNEEKVNMRRSGFLLIVALMLFCCALLLSSCALTRILLSGRDDADPAATVTEPEPAPWRPLHGYLLATDDGDVVVENRESEHDGFKRQTRYYLFPDGDYFYQQQTEYTSAQEESIVGFALLRLDGTQATLRYWDDAAADWVVQELQPGVYPARQYFIVTDQEQAIVVPPLASVARENDMLEVLPAYDGQLTVEATPDGYCLYLQGKAGGAGLTYDYFYITSRREMISWDKDTEFGWAGYLFTGHNRWTYTGYYYAAPSTYIPSGANYYHRLPAAYIVAKLPRYDYPVGKKLSIAMLDVMLGLQNEQGFFPTLAGSRWLLDEYGIGPDFFDTRFNSDLVNALLLAADKYGVDKFAAAAFYYGQFFLSMAEDCHYTLTDAAGNEGWLVYDYMQPGLAAPTHCSLNHQLAEIIVLYRLYAESGDERFHRLAQLMLRGIDIVGAAWIMADNNLHYAYYADGSLGGQDYPYLTYNDLYYLQDILRQTEGGENALLTQLMAAKKSWMDANGVTDYIDYSDTAAGA